VRCGEQQLLAVTTPRERPRIEIGDPVAVELPAAACVVLPS
jgi:TOBE domain